MTDMVGEPSSDPITAIREKLANNPGAKFSEGEGWIRYEPSSESGFVVELQVFERQFIVYFDGWHEHFEDAACALDCFAFGLSDECRLKILSRGEQPHRWVVEFQRNGEWVWWSETGLLLFAFWRAPTVEYCQNHLIRSAEQRRGRSAEDDQGSCF